MVLERISELIVTDDDIRYMLDTETSFIKDYIVDTKATYLPPVLKVLDTTKQLNVFPLEEGEDFNNSANRCKLLQSIGADFWKRCKTEVFPSIAVLSFRAWVKGYKSEQEVNPFLKPSDYVDSTDAIVIQVLSAGLKKTKKKPKAKTGMIALEVVQIKPYLKVKDFIEPTIQEVPLFETKSLLSHFYIGWFKQGLLEPD